MKIIRSHRKSIALVIEADGSLTVRAPQRTPRAEIERLVQEKAAWIAEKQAQARSLPPLLGRFAPGERLPFLGELHPLELVERPGPALALEDGRFRLRKEAAPQAARVFEDWYRAQARRLLGDRTAQLAQRHGFHYTGLRISGARTRWGSCSGRGGLSFSWRLVLAPPAAIDYVILHELVHLDVRDHSARFWARVAQLDPGYAKQRDWLKTHGRSLMA
ncbi:MAG: M48 family metallopeptidase [Chloroflexota bacterium]